MTAAILARGRRLPRPVRFLLAGGGAAAVNWLVRFPLSLFMPFGAAVLVAACIGMAVGFVAYRGFVFGASRPVLRELRDFLAVNAVTSLAVAGLSVLLLALLLAAGMRPTPAEAVAHALGIAAGAVLNYVGHSLFTVTAGRRAGWPEQRG